MALGLALGGPAPGGPTTRTALSPVPGRADADDSGPVAPGAPASRRLRIAGVVLALLIVGFLGWTVVGQWRAFRETEVDIAPAWFAAALAALLLYQAIQGEVAGLVLAGLGHPLPASRMRAIFGAGLLGRYVPSGAVTLVARIGLEQREGVPQRVAVVGLLYEFALALGGAALVAALALAHLSAPLAILALVAGLAILATALHPRVFAAVMNRLLAKLGRPVIDRPLALATVLVALVLCAVSFLFNGLALVFIAAGVAGVPAGATVVIIAAAGVGFITSMLGFVLPGGLGAREAGLILGLGIVLTAPLALTIALICRLLQTLVEVGYTGVVTVLDRRVQRVTSRG